MISFDIANAKGANAINWANRLAARRQTQAQRDAVFAKYQSLVGTMYRNSYQARMEALRELSDPQRTPEYWNEDTQPRLPLGLTSSMLAKIQPVMGGAFIYFQSNPSKPYFYQGGGTEAAAKKIEELVTSPDIGKAFRNKNGL